jgi:hypothetical protein
VGITAGSREIPGRKPVTRDNNNNNNNNNNCEFIIRSHCMKLTVSNSLSRYQLVSLLSRIVSHTRVGLADVFCGVGIGLREDILPKPCSWPAIRSLIVTRITFAGHVVEMGLGISVKIQI